MDTSLAEEMQQSTAPVSADDFFFMSPFRSFIASGIACRITQPACDGESLTGAFQQAIKEAFAYAHQQGIAKPVIVGAIPFDTTRESALFIPERMASFSRTDRQRSARYQKDDAPLRVTGRQSIPEKPDFLEMVARGAALTATPEVDKIVLSRLIDITTDSKPDSGILLERLIAQNPASFNFHVPLADGGVLLGASPELLLRKQGRAFSSLPLAGSAGRQPDDTLDRDAGHRLINSAKDRHEHLLVTQAMKAVLAPRSRTLRLADTPQLVTTPTLWHLATPVEGEVEDERESALSLACLLHPTPALSGFPHDVAKKLIAGLEPFGRDLFGGIVGWCDEEGNGEWVVTIRCARIRDNQIRLFAGAGIVPASSPESEWHETGTKLSTMLNVFGLN